MRQPDLFRTQKKPWNAGRIIGPKAPLKPKHIWSICQQLKTSGRRRDLALLNCAIDAKLRACDLVRVADRATDHCTCNAVVLWRGRRADDAAGNVPAC